MDALKKYDIEIFRLSNETHHYEFKIDNDFFSQFENSLVEKGDLNVQVELEKSSTMLRAYFTISGEIELECDRSLEVFKYPVQFEESIIFKYGEDVDLGTDEIIIIPQQAQQINVAQPIYEFIGVAIPMKKLHPRFEEVTDDELIYISYENESDKKSNIEDTDPRWNVLKKLK